MYRSYIGGLRPKECGKGRNCTEPDGGGRGGDGTDFLAQPSDYYGEVLTKQINRFNETIGKEKNIHVTDVYQGWPGTEALTAGMASESVDNLPDVMMLYTPYLNLVRDYDRLAWVEDYITREDATVKKEDLIANAAKSFVMDGRMIGVPYNLSAILLYYNKDYLEAAGYQAPPKTIAEMAQMLPVIVEKTDAEYGLNVHVESYEFESLDRIPRGGRSRIRKQQQRA